MKWSRTSFRWELRWRRRRWWRRLWTCCDGQWVRALGGAATLDFDGVQVEFVQALEALETIAWQTTFAPESRDAPVQVMGPLEAAGGTFDAVWFLRAGDLSWPAAASVNPLLPWAMQRELGMPGVDAARDAEQARRVTERL